MTAQTLSVKIEQDRAVVVLSGEHEAYTAGKLARHLSALLAEGIGVTVDLRRATFIDSTVIGVLIATHRRAHEAGLDLVLHVGEETGWPVRRLLEVTRLGTRLDIVGWPETSNVDSRIAAWATTGSASTSSSTKSGRRNRAKEHGAQPTSRRPSS
jgi:anti-sigma B factor antagonist